MSPQLEQWLFLEDSRHVTIRNMEKVSGQPETVAFEHDTSFDVRAFANRGTQEFYFAGAADDGSLVVERWELAAPAGSVIAVVQALGQPVGSPSPAPAITPSIVGGASLPVSERLAGPRLTQTELHRGTIPGEVHCMEVDPEGRFLLLVGADGVLYRLDLAQGGGDLVALYDQHDLWILPRVRFIDRVQHETLGRIWLLSYFGEVDEQGFGEPVIYEGLLVDGDNDGVFDVVSVEPGDELYELGVTRSELWTEDFVFYYD